MTDPVRDTGSLDQQAAIRGELAELFRQFTRFATIQETMVKSLDEIKIAMNALSQTDSRQQREIDAVGARVTMIDETMVRELAASKSWLARLEVLEDAVAAQRPIITATKWVGATIAGLVLSALVVGILWALIQSGGGVT